jgi:hypothetical protein
MITQPGCKTTIRKQRAPHIKRVLELLHAQLFTEATSMVTLMVEKRRRKPSKFNEFVKEKMAEMKGEPMPFREKMRLCGNLWKEHKELALTETGNSAHAEEDGRGADADDPQKMLNPM